MSFSVVLHTNKSQANVISKDITAVQTVQCVLRDSASVIDPVLLLEKSDMSFGAASINYAYIEQFGRYYYVTNIVSVNNNLWEIHCHVDVLMTYKTQILAQNAVVARQEEKYNLYFDDGIFMSYQNPKIQTKLFSVANPFETQEFVLIVAGSQATSDA